MHCADKHGGNPTASSAAAHGASSGSYAAHGASLDAAATTAAPASVSVPVARASFDKRGRCILEDWVAPLRGVVQPVWLALGSQQRALVADDLLSGTCSAVYGLLAAELVRIQHRLMVEENAEAVEFSRDQVGSAEYFRPRLQSLFHDHPAPWTPADLLVVGIVCKPVSIANAKRRKADSVENHPDFEIGGLVVDYILERLPWMLLLENVLGWGQKICPEKAAPSAMETVDKGLLVVFGPALHIFVLGLRPPSWTSLQPQIVIGKRGYKVLGLRRART